MATDYSTLTSADWNNAKNAADAAFRRAREDGARYGDALNAAADAERKWADAVAALAPAECAHSCVGRGEFAADLCPACADRLFNEYAEETGFNMLCAADPERNGFVPATDEEYRAHRLATTLPASMQRVA